MMWEVKGRQARTGQRKKTARLKDKWGTKESPKTKREGGVSRSM